MDTAVNYQSSGMLRGAAASMRDVAVPSPVSPVQHQLNRQRELLSELDGATNALIDPMRSVLSHDPRESKGLSGGTEPAPSASCDLDLALQQSNNALESHVQRLREIRNAIRL